MPHSLSPSLVNKLAQEAGFALAAVAPVPAADSETTREERARFDQWIARGAAGEMEYLKRRNESGELVRSTLRAVFPWVKSVIVCAAPYNTDQPRSIDPAPQGSGWISRYSWSEDRTGPEPRPSDYHKILLKRLQTLEAGLKQVVGEFASRCYVDTGPLVERVYARYAGIGWTGKNCTILNQRLGSLFFIAVILTSLEPESPVPQLTADRCGSCTRCIDACPTQALTPYEMDATRCISYLTIEKRGSIPEDLRVGIGRNIFGCDICQDVCPWNAKSVRESPPAEDPELAPREALVNPALGWLASMSRDEFAQWFFGSPIKRARYEGLRRNIAIAMGNSGLAEYLPQLEEWSRDEDEGVREGALWAMEQITENRCL